MSSSNYEFGPLKYLFTLGSGTLKYRQLGKLFINFLDSLDFTVSQHLCFYFTNSLILLCSPMHINLKNALVYSLKGVTGYVR